MLKKTVNYEDFDGNVREETLYFNLTRTELVEVAMDLPDGLTDSVGDDPSKIDENEAARRMFDSLGNKGIYEFLKMLLLKSYGIKSPDGKRIMKTKEITEEFSQTLAFDTIFMEMLSDDKAAAEFVNNILPKDVMERMIAARNTI